MSTTNQVWSNWNTEVTPVPNYTFTTKEGTEANWDNSNGVLNILSDKNDLVSFKTYDQKCGGDINLSDCNSLEFIEIQNASLQNLNVSNLNNLGHLDLQNNSLPTLDASNLSSLKLLLCQNNNLTSINTSGLGSLQYLHCYNNQLTNLSVSGLTDLTSLDCHNNSLSELNLNSNTKLERLKCCLNPISSLNVSSLKELYYFECNRNNLTQLDVSNNTKLRSLGCAGNQLGGNLTGISSLNSQALSFVNISNNNMTKENLEDIFNQLPDKTNIANQKCFIYIDGNPGTETCDKTLATNKGWQIR